MVESHAKCMRLESHDNDCKLLLKYMLWVVPMSVAIDCLNGSLPDTTHGYVYLICNIVRNVQGLHKPFYI